METGSALGIVEILGLAASASMLAGWRLYLVVLATGIAMRTGAIPVPEHLAALQALGNPWVMGIAAIGALAEFFADKVMWLDSAWDAVHTLVRPIGGALLALAIVDPGDPAAQAAALLLGAGGSLLAHGGKAGVRAVVNTSPEPVSNIAVSSAEDIASIGLLWFVYEYPWAAAGVAGVMLLASIAIVIVLRRMWRAMFGRPKPTAR